MHRLVAQLQTLIDLDLTHPAIAAPVATGINGVTAYLALDFVAGESVDVVARDHGPAPVAEAIRVAGQVAAALDFALDATVTHGALHPRDVLVAPDDARLTGIGITQALERMGIPTQIRRPYTAPERIAGAPWDHRADVFSLAAIIHEVLWGRRVSALGEQAGEALTPIAGCDLAALRLLFSQALAEDPSERLSSPVKFVEGLRSALAVGPSVGSGVHLSVSPSVGSGAHLSVGPSVGLGAHPSVGPSVGLGAHPSVGPSFSSGAQLSTVTDRQLSAHEPRLPLDDDAPLSDSENELDIFDVFADPDEGPFSDPANVSVATTASVPTDSPMQPDAPGIVSGAAVLASDRSEGDAEPTIVQAPTTIGAMSLFESSESALDRTRSAVWPLTLALGVGLSVGFGTGYAVASRARPESVQAEASATTPAGGPSHSVSASGVSETEVRLKPASSEGQRVEGPDAAAVTRAASEPARTQTSPAKPEVRAKPAAPSALRRVEGPDSKSTSPLAVRKAAALALPEGRLLIRSTPPGATAFVDGRDVGSTPVTLRAVEPGSHTVRVARAGFVAEERRVALSASRPSQSLNFDLARARAAPAAPSAPATIGGGSGVVNIESRPAGANVLLDGKLVGKTPMTLSDVAAGAHAVSIDLAGYNRWSTSVRVVAGERNRVAASLER